MRRLPDSAQPLQNKSNEIRSVIADRHAMIIINHRTRAVGPTINAVRRHNGMDHLHESSGSLDGSSDSSFYLLFVRRNFLAFSDVRGIVLV